MRIGLTGGIACGKSLTASYFAEAGFSCVDTDAIVHELLGNDEAVRQALRERFGATIFNEDSTVDRRALGKIVFADDNALKWLESILHPRVGARWRAITETASDTPWLVEIPLLFENKLEKYFHTTLCVACNPVRQLTHLRARGIPTDQCHARLRRQLPLVDKMDRADRVITNDGSKAFLKQQVAWLARHFFH